MHFIKVTQEHKNISTIHGSGKNTFTYNYINGVSNNAEQYTSKIFIEANLEFVFCCTVICAVSPQKYYVLEKKNSILHDF